MRVHRGRTAAISLAVRVIVGAWVVLWAWPGGAGWRDGSAVRATRAAVVPKGDRLLGIDVTEARDGGFEAAFAQVVGAGAEVVALPLAWDELESKPGVYASDLLAIANQFYPGAGMAVALGVNPIDTNTLRVPADLAGRPWDDSLVIARFNTLLDWVFQQIPDLDLVSLNIGNEVDGSLATPQHWEAWRRFIAATAAHARSLRAGLRVGTKAMFQGLTVNAVAELQAVNAGTDIVMATYYPLNGDFTVRDPSMVGPDLDLLASLYPGRELALMEAGYPSGALDQSSLTLQTLFIREVFGAWDRHPEIGLVNLTWLTDVSRAAVDQFLDYYGVDDPRFAEYLATLGLRFRQGTGRDKPAMIELRRQALARGWPVTGPVTAPLRRAAGRVRPAP